MIPEALLVIRAGGSVQRFHTQRTVQAESVGKHSFGVAWLCFLLSQGRPSAGLLIAALAHDLGEYATGDVPAPVKVAHPALRRILHAVETEAVPAELHMTLTAEEQRTLKLADIYDGMLFCVEEQRLGNVDISATFEAYYSYAKSFCPLDSAEQEVLDFILTYPRRIVT